MLKVFVKDTETNEVLMDEELDGLYLVGTQREDGGRCKAPRLMAGHEKYAKAALHIGIYDVPRSMLDTLEDFKMPQKIEDETEDDKEFGAFLDGLEKVVRWLNAQRGEDD